jgi:hypothetical protein
MAQGYGVEVSLTTQLVTGRLVRGVAVVIEAFFRRLTTPRGTLLYDLTYGFDVSGFVGAVGVERAQFVIGGMAENELSKDDRAFGVKCTVTLSTDDNGDPMLLLDIDATLVDSEEDFSLTVGVTAVTAELLAAP